MSDHRSQPFEGLARWLADDPGDDPSIPRATTADAGDNRATPHDATPAGTAAPYDRATPDHRVVPNRRRTSARRGTRAAALVAPWLVALAVLAVPARTNSTRSPRADPPAVDVVPSQADDWSSQPAATARNRDDAPANSVAGATPPTHAGVAAAGVRLVRDAVTGRRAGTTAAIDVAVPEPPRPLNSEQWMVRVQTVVLRGDARRWRSATHEVWAVPVGLRAGRAVGLDRPWRVSIETPLIAAVDWSAATVDEDAVRAALRAVDARPAHDMGAQRHPTIADVIRVRIADAGHARYVWLTTKPTIRVLGAPRPAAAPAEGATP